jgi:CspA family cold shock protein
MKGTVKFFNDEKGFGFITTEEGKDVFVHNSEFSEDVTLNEGDSVEFDVAQIYSGFFQYILFLSKFSISDFI